MVSLNPYSGLPWPPRHLLHSRFTIHIYSIKPLAGKGALLVVRNGSIHDNGVVRPNYKAPLEGTLLLFNNVFWYYGIPEDISRVS